MHRLTTANRRLIRPLFAGMTACRAMLFAPLEENNPGHVFADDPGRPGSACIALGGADYTGDVFFGGIADLWGSLNRFIEKGFGFCALDGKKMVSQCQPAFIGDCRAELGAGTDIGHRRRGQGGRVLFQAP